jgi:glycosyltransferase involved in cell wall biosynthesis
MEEKVAVVLLTWKRITNLRGTLNKLNLQTYKNFDVYISNGNNDPNKIAIINKIVSYFSNLRITLSNDGNDLYSFRRITVAKSLAEQGYTVILYIDDDVSISHRYIETCMNQYEPKTYKSGYTWVLYNKGQSYYRNRQKRKDNNKTINYCGTGASMIDASVFLEDGLLKYPDGALKIEDLWLSFYCQHVMGWQLKYMDTDGASADGRDQFALFKQVQKEQINKDVFLKKLVSMGWELPEDVN